MSYPAQTPVMANVPDSHDNLSDAENEYDVTKVNAHVIYETKQPKLTGIYTANAEVVAYQSVEHILDKVVGILYEKYLSSKLNNHTIETTHDLMDLLFANEFLDSDKNNFVDADDEEPPTVLMDNWSRSNIPSKKLIKLEAPVEFNDGTETMVTEDKKVLQKAKDLGKKLIRDAKIENMPAPLDLQEPNELNKTEDDLRQMKERERKRMEEEKAAEMLKRKAENQAKFKQGTADLKKKPFTYDFNGIPILINNAKVEKFPPPAYLADHKIHDPEVEEVKDKKKKKPKEVAPVKTKQKKAPETEQDFVKRFALSVPTFDLLEPQAGVTYMESGKTKNSAKTRYNVGGLTSGSLISTLGSNPRLTKTEYAQMTRGGNLNRTNVGEKESTSVSAAKSPDTTKKTNLDTSAKDWSIKLKDGAFSATSPLRMTHESEKKRDLDFKPEKLEILLKASEELRNESNQPPKIEKKMDKFATDETLKRSPVDAFNMELLNSKDWGKNTYLGSVHSLPKLPGHQKAHLEQSLGLKSKYPRYRIANVPMEKDYSELLAVTLRNQQMA